MKISIALVLLATGCYTDAENVGFSPVGSPRWAISLGGRDDDRGIAVAFDSMGEVIVAGNFIGPADLRSNSATAVASVGVDAVGPAGLVTKRVASDGSERWTVKLVGTTSTSGSYVNDIAIGPQDNVVVAGSYVGTVDFGGKTLTSPPEILTTFIASYSAAGQLEWLTTLNDYAYPAAVAVDASGNVYVTGTFLTSTLSFNGQVFEESAADADTFLFAYDAQGTPRWGTAFQAAPASVSATPWFPKYVGPWPTDIAIAANGDVLVTGGFSVPASFGGAVLHPNASYRSYITRFRSDGLYLASRVFGPEAPFVSHLPTLAIDVAGNIIVQEVERDDGPNADSGDRATIRTFTDTFQELWSTSLATRGGHISQMRALTTTPSGLIVSSAWIEVPYGSATVTGSIEVVAFDPNATAGIGTLGSRMVDRYGMTRVNATAASATGALAFTGAFDGIVDFGAGPFTTHGQDDSDIYIVVVDPFAN